MNILKLLTTVGLFTLVSRITGFVRTVILSAFLGASAVSDSLLMVIRIANFLRKVLAEGAFSSCFVPVFSKTFNVDGRKSAEELASKLYTLLIIITVAISVFVVFFYPLVLKLFAPGFTGERMDLAICYGRICFPFIISTSIVALFSGVLNTLGKFGLPAALQVFVNIGTIITLILAYYLNLDIGLSVSCGFLVTGVIQFLIIRHYTKKHNFNIRLKFDIRSSKIVQIFKNMIPGLLSSGIWQLNLLIDSRFASTLTSGGVSCIFYADQIIQLPLATLGIAIGSALVPVFSKSIHTNKIKRLNVDFNKSIAFSFSMLLPATVGLITLSYPIVTFIIGRGKVRYEDVVIVADLLAVFACALPAYILNKIFIAACFADSNTKTPMYSTLLNMIVNVVLLYCLVPQLLYIGIALSNTIAAYVGVIYLYFKKPAKFKFLPMLKKIAVKQFVASICIFFLLNAVSSNFLNNFFYLNFLSQFLILLLVIVGVIVIYCILGIVLGFINSKKILMEFKK